MDSAIQFIDMPLSGPHRCIQTASHFEILVCGLDPSHYDPAECIRIAASTKRLCVHLLCLDCKINVVVEIFV